MRRGYVMLRIVTSLVALWLAVPCGGPPGAVERTFAPVGMYEGHWGVDYAMDVGSNVIVIADGVVTFAGPVAGVDSVTVDHGGGLRTSYSYLEAVVVRRGERVHRGDVLGTSGQDHGIAALHLSARVNGIYVDPSVMFTCAGGTLRLSPLDP
jgi:murein DD-endopeptidase MepM/ murein hydrolase activator NlpD